MSNLLVAPISPDSSDLSTDSDSHPRSGSGVESLFTHPLSIGEYTVVDKLGQGGMSEVFLSMSHGPGGVRQLLVIKKLIGHMNDEPELVQMFLDEVRLAAQLSHPNVVQTHRAGSHQGQYFLAMEYLRGQPLSRVIRRAAKVLKAPMPYPLTARLVADALAGLHYAHTAEDYHGEPLGVVHRDVSPQNIFVTYEGVVKLLDFGIAKAATQQTKTNTGLIKGKFGYIAPEQAVGENVDCRVDIWSMGVVLWECLTLHRLFKGRTDAASLQMALSMAVPSPNEVCLDIPPALARITKKALERDITQRYQTALEMQEDLEEWLSHYTKASSRASLSQWMTQLYSEVINEERERMRECVARLPSPPQSAPPPLSVPPQSVPPLTITLPESQVCSTPEEPMPEFRNRRLRRIAAAASVAILFSGVLLALTRRAPNLSALAVGHGKNATLLAESEPPRAVERAVELEPITVTTSLVDMSPLPSVAQITPLVVPRRKGKLHSAAPSPRTEVPAQTAPTPHGPAPRGVKTASYGTLTIDSTPWSYVTINNKALGATPVVGLKLEPGTYQVHLKNPELGLESTYPVVIKATQTITRRFGLN